ncbi:MAG TPA: twin-arginine translocase TatA/TatE family subunit [Gemmatimonadales bacterium]|jgi:sec-independent protein translocase protein TatA
MPFKEIGFGEILVLVMVFLLVFGAKKIPEIGQGLGKGIREFKKSLSDTQAALNAPVNDDQAPGPQRMMDSAATRPAAPPAGEPKRLSQ